MADKDEASYQDTCLSGRSKVGQSSVSWGVDNLTGDKTVSSHLHRGTSSKATTNISHDRLSISVPSSSSALGMDSGKFGERKTPTYSDIYLQIKQSYKVDSKHEMKNDTVSSKSFESRSFSSQFTDTAKVAQSPLESLPGFLPSFQDKVRRDLLYHSASLSLFELKTLIIHLMKTACEVIDHTEPVMQLIDRSFDMMTTDLCLSPTSELGTPSDQMAETEKKSRRFFELFLWPLQRYVDKINHYPLDESIPPLPLSRSRPAKSQLKIQKKLTYFESAMCALRCFADEVKHSLLNEYASSSFESGAFGTLLDEKSQTLIASGIEKLSIDEQIEESILSISDEAVTAEDLIDAFVSGLDDINEVFEQTLAPMALFCDPVSDTASSSTPESKTINRIVRDAGNIHTVTDLPTVATGLGYEAAPDMLCNNLFNDTVPTVSSESGATGCLEAENAQTVPDPFVSSESFHSLVGEPTHTVVPSSALALEMDNFEGQVDIPRPKGNGETKELNLTENTDLAILSSKLCQLCPAHFVEYNDNSVLLTSDMMSMFSSLEDNVKVLMTGSFPEGLMGRGTGDFFKPSPSDMDIMIEFPFDTWVDYIAIEETANTHPGYARLIAYQDRKEIYIPSNLSHLVKLQSHGPAFILPSLSDIDAVPCLLYPEWPDQVCEWRLRHRPSGWPSQNLIDAVIRGGCHFVPVAHPDSLQPDIEWRFSFSLAEFTLARSITMTQRRFYIATKTLCKHVIGKADGWCSYYLKSTFFWCCEEIPPDQWTPANIGICFFYILDKLLKFLKERNIPNYFIPSNNMISHVQAELITDIKGAIELFRHNPLASMESLLRELDEETVGSG